MLVFFFVSFLKAISRPGGVMEDMGDDRDIELGGQTTTTASGMKLG